MCQYKCQASRILEFLVSRSLLSPKWNVALERLSVEFSELKLRILVEAVGVEVKEFLNKRKSSNEDIQFSDLETILKLLIDGADGKHRRWWFFGSYSSPIIQGLLQIQNEYKSKNLEQAEICKKLREHIIELRDLQRDQMEKRNSLVDIADRMRHNETRIAKDAKIFVEFQSVFGLSEITQVTKEEISTVVSSFCDRCRSENRASLRADLRDPSLHIFLRDYNERYNRHVKFADQTDQLLVLAVEELLSFARASDNTAMVEILKNLMTKLSDSHPNDPNSVVEEIWRLREKVLNNKTVSRLMEAESKLRQSIAYNERRISELTQVVRETANLAQESIAKIFPPRLEIIVD